MNLKVTLIMLALMGITVGIVGCPVSVQTDVDIDAPADVDVNTDTDVNVGGGDGISEGDDSGSGATDGTGGGDETGDSSDAGGTSNDNGDAGGSVDEDGGTGEDGGSVSGGDGQTKLTGTYTGGLDCVITESLQGAPGPERATMRTLSLSFFGDGKPTGFVIPGYSHDLEFFAEVSAAGHTATLAGSSGDYTATLTVTVASATYNATSGRVILSLDYEGHEGNLTEQGTGMQTVEFAQAGSALTYSSLTSYEVDMIAGTLTLATTKGYDCQGTLSAE